MSSPTSTLKQMGALGIGLLVLTIIMAVALLVGGEFKQEVCEQEGGTYTSTCSVLSSTYNATVDLLNEIISVVGFVGLVVLASIGVMLVKMAKGFKQ